MATGGGGYINVGGISGDVRLETGNLDAQLAKVQGGLEKTAAAMKRWQQEFEAGKISAAQLDSALNPLIAHQDELRASYDRITQAMAAVAPATTRIHTGMAEITTQANRAAVGGKNLSMAFMQLGYIIDDVQYGMMGIVNNVAPLVMSMTGHAGIAASAQIVTVGLYQLTKHWDEFMEAIGVGVIRTEAEEMDKLAKATERTADEQERLNKHKREGKTIGQIAEAEPAKDAERRALVVKAFGEANSGAVRGALAGQMERAILPNEEEQIRQAGEMAARDATRAPMIGGGGNVPVFIPPEEDTPEKAAAREQRRQDAMEAERAKVQERIQKEALTAADKLMAQATQSDAEGAAARASIEAKRKAHPGAFPKKFDENTLANADPEVLRKIDQANQAEADNIEAAGNEGARQKQEENERLDLTIDRAEESGKALHKEYVMRRERRRENVKFSKQAAPGIDEVAERAALMAAASGGEIPMDAVVAEIRGRLMAAGRTEKQATAAAEDITKEAGIKVQEKIQHGRLNPEARRSEVFEAADLAGRIQSSIGGAEDINKRLLAEAIKQTGNLDKLAAQVVNVRIKK